MQLGDIHEETGGALLCDFIIPSVSSTFAPGGISGTNWLVNRLIIICRKLYCTIQYQRVFMTPFGCSLTLRVLFASFTVPIVLGPMARDVDTLVTAMKALLVPLMFQLDRAVPPITFRDEVRHQ